MEILKVFSLKNIWSMSIVFVVVFSAFLLLSHQAQAGDASEYVWFRIDTELDVPNAVADEHVVSVSWSCGGAGLTALIADKTASEYGGAVRDGIIKVASGSKEMTDAGCNFAAGDTIRASASVDGWVTRTKEFTMLASTNYSTYFAARASMDYNLVVGPVTDELDATVTLNSGTASASYSGETASSSYSGNYKYIAAIADGTLTVGSANYVSRTQAVTWSGGYKTASKSATFDGTTGTYNVGKLQYSTKITLNTISWNGEVTSNKTGATVVAGDSLGTSCAEAGTPDGNYYCFVPVTHTGVIAQATVTTYTLSNTCTYTDRTSNTSAQSTCTINAHQPISVTSGGGSVQLPTETTLTPTPTPTAPAEATPTPSLSPTPTPVSAILYRKANDPKVYVQRSDGTLSWVKTIEEFSAAGYRWSDVKVISGSEFAQMKISEGAAPVTAALFRKANDPKVYVQGSDGTLTWVKTLADFNAAGYNWVNVKIISGEEFGKMRVGGSIRVVKEVAFLRVRSGPSTANKVVGQVLPGQELKFTEIKNGWYHISSGWVSGAYAKEF